jgi:hypothetical protein
MEEFRHHHREIYFDLTFKYLDILEEVKKVSSYMAKSRVDKDGKNLLDLANVTTGDNVLIRSFIKKSESDIFDGIAGYMKSDEEYVYFDGYRENLNPHENVPIVFHFAVPESFNFYNKKYIYQLIIWAFVDSIISQWLLIVYPQEAAIYQNKFNTGMSEIIGKLNTRTNVIIRRPSWL